MSDEQLEINRRLIELVPHKDKYVCTIKEIIQEIERLNNILDTLMQDTALLNATGVKEIKPKYVFDRIVMLRERVDKE